MITLSELGVFVQGDATLPRKPFMRMPQIVKLRKRSKPHQLPHISMGGDFHILRPEHVTLIGECLMLWPMVESQMASLLAAIMRAHNDTAVAVYLSLRRNSPRNEAIKKAASITLDKQGMEMLEAILHHSGSLEAERNDLSHGHWGMSTEIEDGILWMSSADNILFHVDWNAKLTGERRMSGREWRTYADKIYVYTKRDLQDIKKKINLLIRIIDHFRSYISSYHGDLPASLAQEVISQLSECAPIREALRTVRTRAQQKVEKEPPQNRGNMRSALGRPVPSR